MSRDIAPSAVIHPGVLLPDEVRIEDFVIVGKPARAGIEKDTTIGDGCYLRSHTVIYSGNHIGAGFQTGHGALMRDDNEVGDNCSLGSGSVIEFAVRLGDRVRIHSQAFIPEYTVIEDDAWIGPNVVITNVAFPSSTRSKESLAGVTIKRGAKIGANSTILPGLVIGEDALIGAGTVVTADVPERSVVVGNPGVVKKSIDELRYDEHPDIPPYPLRQPDSGDRRRR
ncbi:MAG: acyltransferase [Planctomycetota bacterium]